MASTDPNVLAANAECIDCKVPTGFQWSIVIWLLTQIAGVSADPNVLVANATCIQCGVPDGMKLSIIVWLLTQISSGGGGGVNNLVIYTAGTPANPPDPTKNSLAYDPTGNLPTLGWNTVTQTWN